MAVASAPNQPEIALKLKINKTNHKGYIMTAILHIQSSSNVSGSLSRKIGALTMKGLKETHPDTR
jgi:hypothetical protein